MPEARAHHAGAVFGAGLFIHGGLGAEGPQTLSDWNLFDFGLQVWLSCSVNYLQPDGSQQEWKLSRKYHSLTPVLEPGRTNERELTRLVWSLPLSEIEKKPVIATKEQGMFLFGGIDEHG